MKLLLLVSLISSATAQQCGVQSIKPRHVRIVGGVEAIRGSWPWMVSLQGTVGGTHFCGASLISAEFAVTAAHCTSGQSASGLKVVIGNHDRYVTESSERHVGVAEIVQHPSFQNPIGLSNDLSILRLSEKVDFNTYIQPVCLADTTLNWRSYPGNCYAIGWGDTHGTGDSSKLNQVGVPLIQQSTCQRFDWYGFRIDDSMLCAGYAAGGKDSCQGDSGGPLVCQSESDRRWYLVGATSWGSGCAEARKPGVYSYIPENVAWIRTITGM